MFLLETVEEYGLVLLVAASILVTEDLLMLFVVIKLEDGL